MSNLLVRIHQFFLDKKLKSRKRKSGTRNLETAKSIGILFNASDPDDRKIVLEYADKLRKKSKNVTVLGYLNEKQDCSNFPFDCFNKKNVNFIKIPNSKVVNRFIATDFDLLICLSANLNLPLEYIAALSKATMKVGPVTEKTYCFDMMIDTEAKLGIPHFIKQMEHFLTFINNNPTSHGAKAV